MAHILIRHAVESYDTFKPVYDDAQTMAEGMGQIKSDLYQDSDNPNMITAVVEFDTDENAKRFTESDELKEAMGKAGVVGAPEITFLNRNN
ncbi:MAG: cyclase [Bacteroidetes bacterium]|nr:cyclase [Bacteroidota bacterium]